MRATLSPKWRRQVGAYLRTLADALGLRDWTIHIAHDPPRDGQSARMETTSLRRHVTIWLPRDFPTVDPAEQRQTLVHELLHVPVCDIRDYLTDVLPDLLGKPASLAITEHVRHVEELAVDQVAEAIATLLPMPPWAKP